MRARPGTLAERRAEHVMVFLDAYPGADLRLIVEGLGLSVSHVREAIGYARRHLCPQQGVALVCDRSTATYALARDLDDPDNPDVRSWLGTVIDDGVTRTANMAHAARVASSALDRRSKRGRQASTLVS